jgi:hypothetical protein
MSTSGYIRYRSITEYCHKHAATFKQPARCYDCANENPLLPSDVVEFRPSPEVAPVQTSRRDTMFCSAHQTSFEAEQCPYCRAYEAARALIG